MADDPWKRFRQRNLDKKPANNVVSLRARRQLPGANAPMGSQPAEVPDDLNTLLEQMPVLLDQLNHLYNMFIAGVERRPPVEKRKFVENMVAKIAGAPKTSPQIRFKCGAAIQGAQANFERWDKLVRGLESGAIKRRVGPGRGTGGKTGMG